MLCKICHGAETTLFIMYYNFKIYLQSREPFSAYPAVMYMNFITYHLHQPAIMNLPMSLFYPPNTALLLTSDNSLSLFLPSSSLLPSSCSFPWWLLLETVMWGHLYCVFTYIYTFLLTKTSVSIEMS